jgi:predicted ferric reductase
VLFNYAFIKDPNPVTRKQRYGKFQVMKKRNRYRNYLSLEAAVIVLVILCFKLIPDKQTASVITSLLFLGSSLGILYWESKFAGYLRRPSFWGVITFLVLSAIPVFGLRLVYWDLPFEQIEVAGFTGPQLHQFSNIVFLVMLVAFFVDSYTENVKARQFEVKSQKT